MTQLYRLDCTAPQIEARFGLCARDDPWAGGYVAPAKFAPIITAGREFVAGPRPAGARIKPRMAPRLWGVSPPPSADDLSRRITSVRNTESPFWIGNLRNSEFRCIVPATSVMLWGSGTDYEGRRNKHWFASQSEQIFAMAGVWKDEDVPAFALITMDPQEQARAAGCRSMPLVLPDNEEARQAWLHDGWDSARKLLKRPAMLSQLE